MEKIGTGFIYLVISQVFTVLGGLVINIFLSRFLGKELYGRYSFLIVGVMVIGYTIISNGFPQTLSRYISEEKYENEPFVTKILVVQLIESLIIMLIYLAISPLLVHIFKESELLILLFIAAITIPTQGLISFLVGLYNGLKRFKTQAIMVSLISLAKVICILILATFFEVLGAILGVLLATLIIALIYLFYSRKFYVKDFSFKITKDIWQYLFRITLFSLLLSLLLSLDINCLKFFLTSNQNAQLGVYNAGAVVARTGFFIIVAFSGVMFPTISKLLAKGKKNQAQVQIGEMLRISSIFLVPIVLILASMSPILVNLFFGSEYNLSAIITTILVFGYSLIGYFVIFSNILNSIGEVRITIMTSISIIGIDIGLLYFFIKYVGLAGAAIATTISSFIGVIFVVYFTIRKIGININLHSLIRINVIAITLFGVTNFILVLFLNNIAIWVGVLIAEIVLYFVFLYIVRDFNVIAIFKEYREKLFYFHKEKRQSKHKIHNKKQ